MRATSLVLMFASIAAFAACDMFKKGDDKADGAAGASSGSGSTTTTGAGAGTTTDTTAKAADTSTSDPSKGGLTGCQWPENGDKDVTITKGCALTVKNNVELKEGATMTIEEGVKLSFDTDRYLWVEYGKLVIKGTDAAPVTFTSANKSPAPGDWVGVGFREKTMAGTSIDHLIVEFAGSKASSGDSGIHIESMRQGGRISITNTTVRGSAQFGLYADENATFTKFENNTFKDNKSGSVRVKAEVLGSVGRGNTFNQPIHVFDSTIDQTTTWPAFDQPVYVDGNLLIKGDSTAPVFTIADKTVVKMGQDRYISIGEGNGGALVAKNVTFTSGSPSPSEGDWGTVFIYGKSGGTDIENCTFEYFGATAASAQGAITLYNLNAKDAHFTLKDNVFRKGKQAAMKSDDNDCAPFAKINKAEGVPFCHPH